jgi:hypothetical protein
MSREVFPPLPRRKPGALSKISRVDFYLITLIGHTMVVVEKVASPILNEQGATIWF